MQQDTASFWSDIKTLDSRLKDNPDSLCFAQLADVYLKVGLADDALHLARQGVQRYPRYIAGQRVLAQACHAKGLQDECRQALEQLTAAIPEDTDAQKMLARLYLQSENTTAAIECFQTVLDFYPDDNESVLELKTLLSSPATAPPESSTPEESDDEFIEELDEEDILEIDDLDLIIDEEPDESEFPVADQSVPPAAASRSEQYDPLSTVTLAELYVKQGFIDKALVIYRALLADTPENLEVQARIRDLEPQPASVEIEIADSTSADALPAMPFDFMPSEPLTDFAPPLNITVTETDTITPPAVGSADNRVATLSSWLENIRRIKSCR